MNHPHAEQAANLLVHYFRMLFEQSCLRFDSDNEVEIRSIVESIMLAAIEPGNR